jgi:transposase
MPDWDALSREELVALARSLWERVAALEEELARQRKDPPSGIARPVPSFVKPNVPRREKQPRKKRAQAYVRRRGEPTEVVDHKPERCPDCGRKLCGGRVQRIRQVIELPAAPVRVIEHRIWSCWCGVCRKRVVSRPDLSGEVLGSHRMGIRLMSLVSYLHRVARCPKRRIRELLKSLYGLRLSVGEVSEILHAVAQAGARLYDGLRERVRGSPSVHADETSWREEGQNGWLWSFSTPSVRYFKIAKSRAHMVPEEVLGSNYPGVIVSDFYGGYSYHLGEHQRCWVHFLRDLHALKDAYPDDGQLVSWVKRVIALYQKARDFKSPKRSERLSARFAFQDALVALGEEFTQEQVPQRTLAQRCVRFASELFTFVEHPDVPSHNNAAERSVRPSVIARKVSGGTRSERGSRTTEILMSLFGTWSLEGANPLDACQMMLVHSTHCTTS